VPDELEGPENAPKTLAKSITSFKTLTECPIIVVLLLQIHRNVIATNMPRLVPLIMDMLALQAGPQAEGHAAAAARGEILTGPAPGIRNKTLFGEFVVCQVKTMSLLAFLLRSPNDALKSFRQQIPEHVVRLLKDCPPELSAARKVGFFCFMANGVGITGCHTTRSKHRFPRSVPFENRHIVE